MFRYCGRGALELGYVCCVLFGAALALRIAGLKATYPPLLWIGAEPLLISGCKGERRAGVGRSMSRMDPDGAGLERPPWRLGAGLCLP